MSRFEQYLISYEDWDELRTSRWLLEGVDTRPAGNTHRGWLFARCAADGDTLTAEMYKDPACDSGQKVLAGSADVSAIDAAAVEVALSEQNSSGLSGRVFLEEYHADPPEAVPVLVSLCTDGDLAEEWYDLSALPGEVYDAGEGMAKYCAAATRRCLLLVSQMYGDHLGGSGGREHVHYQGAARTAPDWRRLIVPDQLRDAAVCWALELAFGACHKLGEETMYSRLRGHYANRRKEAVAAWNFTFNTDPDSDRDADAARSITAVRISRI